VGFIFIFIFIKKQTHALLLVVCCQVCHVAFLCVFHRSDPCQKACVSVCVCVCECVFVCVSVFVDTTG